MRARQRATARGSANCRAAGWFASRYTAPIAKSRFCACSKTCACTAGPAGLHPQPPFGPAHIVWLRSATPRQKGLKSSPMLRGAVWSCALHASVFHSTIVESQGRACAPCAWHGARRTQYDTVHTRGWGPMPWAFGAARLQYCARGVMRSLTSPVPGGVAAACLTSTPGQAMQAAGPAGGRAGPPFIRCDAPSTPAAAQQAGGRAAVAGPSAAAGPTRPG